MDVYFKPIPSHPFVSRRNAQAENVQRAIPTVVPYVGQVEFSVSMDTYARTLLCADGLGYFSRRLRGL